MKILLLILFFQPCFAEVDFQGFYRARASFYLKGIQDDISNTFQVKTSFKPSKDIQTNFWLQSSYKQNSQLPLQIYADSVWFLNSHINLRLGRFPYQTPASEFVSSNFYQSYPNLFHGMSLAYQTSALNMDMSLGKVFYNDEMTFQSTFNQMSMIGFFTNLKMESVFLQVLELHLIYLTNSWTNLTSKQTRYGLLIKGSLPLINLKYSAEGVIQGDDFHFGGSENTYSVEVAYENKTWLNVEAFARFRRSSAAYLPWMRDQHQQAGLSDILSSKNLQFFLVGLRSMLAGLNLELRYYILSSVDKGDVRFGFVGNKLFEKKLEVLGRENLGQEVNFLLEKSVSKSLSFSMLTSLFIPSKILLSTKEINTYYNQIEITSLYKF